MSLAPKHHAPTHAWPSLPINPNPNSSPPNLWVSATHFTAAQHSYFYDIQKIVIHPAN